jgi:hypothetical protein
MSGLDCIQSIGYDRVSLEVIAIPQRCRAVHGILLDPDATNIVIPYQRTIIIDIDFSSNFFKHCEGPD